MDNTQKFIIVVREYINLIDTIENYTLYNFLSRCVVLLPQVYYLGLLLPDVELDGEIDNDETPIVDYKNNKSKTMSRISRLFGEYNLYSEVFDPISDTKAIQTTIGDDLSDIYWDLKCPFADYNNKQRLKTNSAIWEWKFNIRYHCGDHIVSVLRPLHQLVFDYVDKTNL